MRKITLLLSAVIILGSCASPKYSYNFDYHNYNAGKKKSVAQEEAPLQADPSLMVASTSNAPIVLAETSSNMAPAAASKESIVLTKTQRKALKVEMKQIIKESKASKKAGKEAGITKASASGIDHDLKLAAIFGAVGIVGLIIGGNVMYVIGAIALLIGVVFFVKWLVRQ